MQNDLTIQQAADRLFDANKNKAVCAPVRDIIGDSDIEKAYSVQEINTKRKLNAGEYIVGYKVGLTSFAVQEQLGVDQPDFGVLTNTMQLDKAQSISVSELMQPKAEAEIAFILGKVISSRIESIHDLVGCIDYACASIEIVGSRIENWNIRITDTIADNASASHFILGDQHVALKDIDVVQCKMQMTKNGEVASTGTGKACMDNPLIAAQWLINTLVSRGVTMKKGAIILSGALGPMVNVSAGDHFSAQIEGLGSVDVSFTK